MKAAAKAAVKAAGTLAHRRVDEIANEITALRLDVLREDEVPVEDQLVPVGKRDAVLSTCMRAPGSRSLPYRASQHQLPSEALRGGGHSEEEDQRQSEAIRGNQRQSEAIRGNQSWSHVAIGLSPP